MKHAQVTAAEISGGARAHMSWTDIEYKRAVGHCTGNYRTRWTYEEVINTAHIAAKNKLR